MSEKSLVKEIEEILEVGKENILGSNEDAVAFTIENSQILVNVDAWVESTDRIPGFEPFDCGFRAAINSISDIYAKGGKPLYLLASSGIPSQRRNEIIEIVKGIKQACTEYGLQFMGGDLNQSEDLFIDVTVIGTAQTIHKRSTAQIGETVYWLGPPLGENTAAFGVLLQNWNGEKKKALEILRRPRLFPEFLEIEANASIDCSDGLARTLYIVTEASKVGINLELPNSNSEFLKEIATANDKNLHDLALFGGEELGIVFTMPPENVPSASCLKIGQIVETKGVWINGEKIQNRGWDHFQ